MPAAVQTCQDREHDYDKAEHPDEDHLPVSPPVSPQDAVAV
jgi:hypothetical protein